MMMKQIFLLILIFSIVQLNLTAQTETKSDSLKKEFYKKPPYINLSLEVNREKITLTDNYNFWFEVKNKRYNPRLVNNNQFLLDSISDTVNIVFTYNLDTLRFTNIGYMWIRNGAEFKFGIIDNLETIRTYYRQQKRNKDFNELTDLGQPYLRLLENKKVKREKKKIGIINFLILKQRVYDGSVIIEVLNIKRKKE